MQANSRRKAYLRDVLTLEYGAGLPESIRSGQGYPVFGSSGLVGYHEHLLIQGPGIILGRKGSVGAVSWSESPFWPIDTTYYVQPIGDTNLRWCYWLLSWLPLRTLDSSTGVPGLNRNDVYQLLVVWPSLGEQQRIADFLDRVEAAIQEAEAFIAKFKKVRVGLLHDLLAYGLDENGRLRNPVVHPDQFTTTELGLLPISWKLERLGDMCALLNGLAFKPEDWSTEGIPIIRIQNLNGGSEFNHFAGIPNSDYLVPPGTLLFSWSGNRGTSFGPFIWKGPRGILNQHIFKVTCRADVVTKWFYYALDGVRQRAERFAHGGSGLVHVKRTDLVKYLVAVPPEDEQHRIVRAAEEADGRLQAEEAYLEKLKLLKQGVMDDLLTGRVRVPVVEETAV